MGFDAKLAKLYERVHPVAPRVVEAGTALRASPITEGIATRDLRGVEYQFRAQALRSMGWLARRAQMIISGTPLPVIEQRFETYWREQFERKQR